MTGTELLNRQIRNGCRFQRKTVGKYLVHSEHDRIFIARKDGGIIDDSMSELLPVLSEVCDAGTELTERYHCIVPPKGKFTGKRFCKFIIHRPSEGGC